MFAAQPTRPSFNPRVAMLIASATLWALAGCAQQQPVTTHQANESTLTDAQSQARGRSTSVAPSQVQLGFGENAPKPNTQTEVTEGAQADKAALATQGKPLREAKTFLGTLPCMMGNACDASRVTLTLAPNGQWRARSQPLDATNASRTAQLGCWDVIGVEPWRIRLRVDGKESSLASLTFVTANMLRVNTVNGQQPTLDYHLTRQADIDGIDELKDSKVPNCE